VKHTLGIPQSANLTTALLFSDHYFGGDKFLKRARAQGGFDRAILKLVRAVHRGRVVRFPGQELPSGYGEDLLKWGGEQLASGAVSYVGGLAMGWVLGQLGAQDAVQAQLDQIEEALGEINSRLIQIQQQLTS
jgi:hypothetical protein